MNITLIKLGSINDQISKIEIRIAELSRENNRREGLIGLERISKIRRPLENKLNQLQQEREMLYKKLDESSDVVDADIESPEKSNTIASRLLLFKDYNKIYRSYIH